MLIDWCPMHEEEPVTQMLTVLENGQYGRQPESIITTYSANYIQSILVLLALMKSTDTEISEPEQLALECRERSCLLQ